MSKKSNNILLADLIKAGNIFYYNTTEGKRVEVEPCYQDGIFVICLGILDGDQHKITKDRLKYEQPITKTKS